MSSMFQDGFHKCLMFFLDAAKQTDDHRLFIEYMELIKHKVEGGICDNLKRDIGAIEEFLKIQYANKLSEEIETKV
ncbi:hypothetical protein [Candidatus Borrarchaeum sp.]|uniref:hypothetical protein n=1 Tax=Candidatus Borrarchaeum sp. TaxID=2846742 RepID=UPI00257A2F95|nr:hypothetical protein [Candidatus Borrarchaeum sp.]